MIKKVNVAVYSTIKSFIDGKFQGGTQVFDLKSGGIDYSTSGGFVADIKSKLDDLKQRIISGDIKVPNS